MTLTFANMKQGKNLVLPLNVRVSAILLDYLRSYDGPELLSLSPNVPIWVYLSEVPMNAKQLAYWEYLGRPRYLPLAVAGHSPGLLEIDTGEQNPLGPLHLNKLAKQAGAALGERQEMLAYGAPRRHRPTISNWRRHEEVPGTDCGSARVVK
ncbi:MAG TPA: hypothetical protein VNG51_06440 [Ktedonobacteraceae bacterium]|nr:hypothetical protein [Ktedonobacteraceae bacterium]